MGICRSIVAIIVGVALLLPSAVGHAEVAEPVSLAFQPKAGDHWRSEATVEVNEEAWLGYYEDRSKLLRRQRLASTVTATSDVTGQEPDGSTSIEIRPVRLTQNTSLFVKDGGETVTSFDTDAIDAALSPEISEAYAHFADLRYFGTLDGEGRLVTYRVEPEGNHLGDILAAALSKILGDDVAKLPGHAVAPGDTWTIAPAPADASIMGLGNGRLHYTVEARLVAVEQRGNARHALVSMTANKADHIRESETSGPGLDAFSYRALYEFDLDRRRRVASRLSVVFGLFALDPGPDYILHAEQKAEYRETDLDTPNWMIAAAWDAGIE